MNFHILEKGGDLSVIFAVFFSQNSLQKIWLNDSNESTF